MNCRNLSAPPLVGTWVTAPSRPFSSAWVGVRSRLRSVLGIPTMMSGEQRLWATRKSTMPPTSLMWPSPSVRYRTGYLFLAPGPWVGMRTRIGRSSFSTLEWITIRSGAGGARFWERETNEARQMRRKTETARSRMWGVLWAKRLRHRRLQLTSVAIKPLQSYQLCSDFDLQSSFWLATAR